MIAFLFPGQGSQKVGMGKQLAANFTLAKQVFAAADDALGFKLSTLCFEGPEAELTATMVMVAQFLLVLGVSGRRRGSVKAGCAPGAERSEAARVLRLGAQ